MVARDRGRVEGRGSRLPILAVCTGCRPGRAGVCTRVQPDGAGPAPGRAEDLPGAEGSAPWRSDGWRRRGDAAVRGETATAEVGWLRALAPAKTAPSYKQGRRAAAPSIGSICCSDLVTVRVRVRAGVRVGVSSLTTGIHRRVANDDSLAYCWPLCQAWKSHIYGPTLTLT